MANEQFDLLEQVPKGAKKPVAKVAVIAAAAAVAVLAGGYLGCCAAVNQDTVLGHYTVGEVDLKGMTREEAVAALEQAYQNGYSDIAIPVQSGDKTYQVQVADALSVDVTAAVDEAMERGHGSFLTRGGAFLSALAVGRQGSVTPTVSNVAALDQAIQDSGVLEWNVEATPASYEIQEEKLVLTTGQSGTQVDQTALAAALEESLRKGDYETAVVCPFTEVPAEALDVQAVYDAVYTEPANATLDPSNGYAIVASKDGVSFDVEAAAAALSGVGEGEQVSVDLVYTKAKISTSDLEENLFADRLGSYTTNVSGTSARKSNVKLSARKCSGIILLPGETFSYNEAVGQRTVAAGFKEASAYSNGKTVMALGGGICQTSSTLYNAALLANLEITSRRNHSFVSDYVPLGRDATVSWGGPEFEFTNNTDYPIKISCSYSDSNKLTCSIYGTDVNHYTVKITSEVLSTNPHSVQKKETDELYEGETKKEVSGYDGCTVQTYRKVYDANGNLVSSTKEAYSSYSRRDEVLLVGTKKRETTPEPEPQPEPEPSEPSEPSEPAEPSEPSEPADPSGSGSSAVTPEE